MELRPQAATYPAPEEMPQAVASEAPEETCNDLNRPQPVPHHSTLNPGQEAYVVVATMGEEGSRYVPVKGTIHSYGTITREQVEEYPHFEEGEPCYIVELDRLNLEELAFTPSRNPKKNVSDVIEGDGEASRFPYTPAEVHRSWTDASDDAEERNIAESLPPAPHPQSPLTEGALTDIATDYEEPADRGIDIENPVYVILPCFEPVVFGAWKIAKGAICGMRVAKEELVIEGEHYEKGEIIDYKVKLDAEYLKRHNLAFPYGDDVSLTIPREALHSSPQRAAHVLSLSSLEDNSLSYSTAVVLRLH